MKRSALFFLSVVAVFLIATDFALAAARISGRASVVKIYVTFQSEDYSQPWQGGRPSTGTGSGFIISGKRILTNAHVASNARMLQVQKDGDPKRYDATVEFAGHDCDLAVLTVDAPDFFKGTKPVKFAEALPKLNDEVTVIGYPLGGDHLSLTRGVVSRIDYSPYAHSGADQHLVLQVDAAINPGNSGGPVFFGGKVVGLAFQGLAWAENIGYAIPMPVIRHFLDDIADGKYNGYPELGVATLDGRNDALRRDLGLTPERTGIIVYYVDAFGSARNVIYPRDVLLAIDGSPIANDGTIKLGDTTVLFAELIERKQYGESITLKVWRNNEEKAVVVALDNPVDPFAYRNIYDKRPEYFIAGGLVFSPLNREYLRTLERRQASMNSQQLLYYSEYAKIDSLYTNREEFVVLATRLPHPVNTYADSFIEGIVTYVNGVHISQLADVKTAMKTPTNGFHIVQFAGMDDKLVLDAKAVRAASAEILSDYGVSSPEYFQEDDAP